MHLASREIARHTLCMKRANLILDEKLLNDAVRVLGAKTYSDAVNQALVQTINIY